MKKFWKALGIAALAVAVPVRIRKDEENRKKTYQSLLISVDMDTDENGKTSSIGISIGDGVLGSAIMDLVDARKESELFADDEPEAAVLDAGELQVLAGEVQGDGDRAQSLVRETQDTAGEVQAVADEMAEADLDPEF